MGWGKRSPTHYCWLNRVIGENPEICPKYGNIMEGCHQRGSNWQFSNSFFWQIRRWFGKWRIHSWKNGWNRWNGSFPQRNSLPLRIRTPWLFRIWKSSEICQKMHGNRQSLWAWNGDSWHRRRISFRRTFTKNYWSFETNLERFLKLQSDRLTRKTFLRKWLLSFDKNFGKKSKTRKTLLPFERLFVP